MTNRASVAKRRVAEKRRAPARKARTAVAARARGERRGTGWIIIATVLAVGASVIVVVASGSHRHDNSVAIVGREPAPAALVAQVAGVPRSVLTNAGGDTASARPDRLPGPPLRSADGKPRIIYLGAEFCPFCATERWPMVQALSRFGTFSNLQITTSAPPPETDPNTATFSFYGATFKSAYIQFEPIEQEDNASNPLESPTPEQANVIAQYNAPPYLSGPGGTIPFIDFANEYAISGASYDPAVLQGKSHARIAAALADPSTAISRGVVGAANVITATICRLTNNAPASACRPMHAIESQLG